MEDNNIPVVTQQGQTGERPELPHLSTEPTMMDGFMDLLKNGGLSGKGEQPENIQPAELDMNSRLEQVEQSLSEALTLIRELKNAQQFSSQQEKSEIANLPEPKTEDDQVSNNVQKELIPGNSEEVSTQTDIREGLNLQGNFRDDLVLRERVKERMNIAEVSASDIESNYVQITNWLYVNPDYSFDEALAKFKIQTHAIKPTSSVSAAEPIGVETSESTPDTSLELDRNLPELTLRSQVIDKMRKLGISDSEIDKKYIQITSYLISDPDLSFETILDKQNVKTNPVESGNTPEPMQVEQPLVEPLPQSQPTSSPETIQSVVQELEPKPQQNSSLTSVEPEIVNPVVESPNNQNDVPTQIDKPSWQTRVRHALNIRK